MRSVNNERDDQHMSIEKIQLDYWKKRRHPFSGGIELTSRCNLRCVHCYLQDYDQQKHLTTNEVKKIIDQLYKKGVLFLYFTGGEIFTREDFEEIYVYTKKKGFIVELLTNGTLLNERLLSTFQNYPPASINISMYGASEETYYKVTGFREAYRKVVSAIKKLRENDFEVEVKFIAMKENTDDFYLVEAFAVEHGCRFSFTHELFQTLSGDNCTQNHMLPVEDIVAFEETYERTRRVWSANVTDKNIYTEMGAGTVPLFMCDIASNLFVIDCEGFINPCNKLRPHKFSILDCDFDEAWESYRKLKDIMATEKYACLSCKNISICNPCPARNYMATGDYETPDPNVCHLTTCRAKIFSQPKYRKYVLEYLELKNSH